MDADERAQLTAAMDQFVAAASDATGDIQAAMVGVDRAVCKLWDAMAASGVPRDGLIGACSACVNGPIVRLAIEEARR